MVANLRSYSQPAEQRVGSATSTHVTDVELVTSTARGSGAGAAVRVEAPPSATMSESHADFPGNWSGAEARFDFAILEGVVISIWST